MEEKKNKPAVQRFYRKRIELFQLLDRIKLWPSRKGILHGIKSIEKTGSQAVITTHCNRRLTVNNSRNSRAARALRNKWFVRPCAQCAVPEWKLEKYAGSFFRRRQASLMIKKKNTSL
jgi:pyrrolysyl-tRNA synthetase-like protein